MITALFLIISRASLWWRSFWRYASNRLSSVWKGHHCNDVVIICNYHYSIAMITTLFVIISRASLWWRSFWRYTSNRLTSDEKRTKKKYSPIDNEERRDNKYNQAYSRQKDIIQMMHWSLLNYHCIIVNYLERSKKKSKHTRG